MLCIHVHFLVIDSVLLSVDSVGIEQISWAVPFSLIYPQSIARYLSLMISFSTLKFSFFTSCRENRHLCDLRRERCLYRFHISLLPSFILSASVCSICSCGYTESIHLFIPATFYLFLGAVQSIYAGPYWSPTNLSWPCLTIEHAPSNRQTLMMLNVV